MAVSWVISLLLVLRLHVGAYNSRPLIQRRDLLHGILSAATLSAAAPPAAAVLGSKYCASGVGEGCEDLSEGNELIKSLQEKSAANKERHEREAREAYYMKNYPDWFASIGKTLIKKADGTFMTVNDKVLEELKRANRLTLEIPKAMNGQVTDLTQKPILVLKE